MSCEQSLRTCGGLPTYHLTAGSLRAIPTSMGKLLPRSLSIMLCPSNPPLFSGGLESAVTVVGAVGLNRPGFGGDFWPWKRGWKHAE